ncbi:MAG TPA: ribosome biogenesis GTP-binding protein YihA/YsxC [Burkholderiales bacterium]|nr:ribosome biogenesis GTP-binding protein YihA/YsxC [Burkholderiales bacterium]
MFSQAEFIASVGKLSELPPEGVPELVFAGRSNVGKSSAINALAGRKRLAFFSKTPGRTQTINFYDLGGQARLVDLPGYGYARVPQSVRAQWDSLVGGYLSDRASLAGVVVIMDARHPFMPHDLGMLRWVAPLGLPLLVLLSKADKLPGAERKAELTAAQRRLALVGAHGEVLLFSSPSGEGVDQTRATLERWLRARLAAGDNPAAGNKRPPVKGK